MSVSERSYGQWSYQAHPGLETSWSVDRHRIVITNITLPYDLEDLGTSTLYINHARIAKDNNDDSFLNACGRQTLATLIPNAVETVTVDISLDHNDSIAFEVSGNNTLHLAGYYVGLYDMTDNLFDAPLPLGKFPGVRKGNRKAPQSKPGSPQRKAGKDREEIVAKPKTAKKRT
ncbi:hypothetical protein BDZ89DRAFT_1037111 [Hymenopellis radicata]|nr:hypothetical protein BDZ89DRAFT_1037111 [Hymenopellis radicata]